MRPWTHRRAGRNRVATSSVEAATRIVLWPTSVPTPTTTPTYTPARSSVRTAEYTNHLSCCRSAPRDRRNRRTRETTAAAMRAVRRIPKIENRKESSISLAVASLMPIGLGTVRPAASSVEDSADKTVTDVTETIRSHSTGRHRRDGRPEGNRSKGTKVEVASSGYQYQIWVQAASSAAGERGPGLLKVAPENDYPRLPMAVRTP